MTGPTPVDPPAEWDDSTMLGDNGRPHPFIVACAFSVAIGNIKIGALVEPGQAHYERVEHDGSIWEWWINPHNTEAQYRTTDGPGIAADNTLAPFCMAIYYNGWPWALGNPFNMTHGDHENPNGATPERFARACKFVQSHKREGDGNAT